MKVPGFGFVALCVEKNSVLKDFLHLKVTKIWNGCGLGLELHKIILQHERIPGGSSKSVVYFYPVISSSCRYSKALCVCSWLKVLC